jgi:hypothetical protein
VPECSARAQGRFQRLHHRNVTTNCFAAHKQRHWTARRRCQASRCPDHDPVQPQVPGQQAHKGRDHGAVGPVRLRVRDLATQDSFEDAREALDQYH